MGKKQVTSFLERDVEDLIEREIREREADWNFIKSLDPRLKSAVELFIKTGDLRMAQKIAKMDLEDFINLLRKAKVPVFITVIDD